MTSWIPFLFLAAAIPSCHGANMDGLNFLYSWAIDAGATTNPADNIFITNDVCPDTSTSDMQTQIITLAIQPSGRCYEFQFPADGVYPIWPDTTRSSTSSNIKYPPGETGPYNCRWEFKFDPVLPTDGSATNQPTITFDELDFELQGGGSCASDFVKVLKITPLSALAAAPDDVDGNVNNNQVKMCGTLAMSYVFTKEDSSNKIRVDFKGDTSVNKRGFRAVVCYN